MLNQPGEWIFILIIILLLFGPKRLPALARSLGEAIREFRRAAQGVVEESGPTNKNTHVEATAQEKSNTNTESSKN